MWHFLIFFENSSRKIQTFRHIRYNFFGIFFGIFWDFFEIFLRFFWDLFEIFFWDFLRFFWDFFEMFFEIFLRFFFEFFFEIFLRFLYRNTKALSFPGAVYFRTIVHIRKCKEIPTFVDTLNVKSGLVCNKSLFYEILWRFRFHKNFSIIFNILFLLKKRFIFQK